MTPQDKELLAKKGISEAQIAEQLACFQKGFPFLKLDAAASVEKGILAPDADEQGAYLAAWDAYKNTEKTIVKFVPASGAASRMFKNLFEFLGADYDQPTTKFEQAFFESIEKFAFYDDLNVACQRITVLCLKDCSNSINMKKVHVRRLKNIWPKVLCMLPESVAR